MAEAVELAALVGFANVDEALGLAAAAGRFGDSDTLAIVRHRASGQPAGVLVIADPAHALRPGTAGWAGFTTTGGVP